MNEWENVSESDIEQLASQNKQDLLVDLIEGTKIRYNELLEFDDFSTDQKNQININMNNQLSLLKHSLDDMLTGEFNSLINNYVSSDDLTKFEINKRINEIISFYRSYFKNDEYANYLEQLFQNSLVNVNQSSTLSEELDELSSAREKVARAQHFTDDDKASLLNQIDNEIVQNNFQGSFKQ